MLENTHTNGDVWAYGRDTTQGLITVYAMRMAAVFTLWVEHGGPTRFDASSLGLLRRIRRGAGAAVRFLRAGIGWTACSRAGCSC